MNDCIIIGAGDCRSDLLPEKKRGDLWIAADGGLRVLSEAGILPDQWIGDADSLNAPPEGLPVTLLPTVKDDTDLIAACRYGLSKGFREFYLYGVLGGERFSHSVAALETLTFLRDNGAYGTIVDARSVVRLLRDETVVFPAAEKRFFSLFSLTDSAVVTVKGAKYPLSHAVLRRGFPLGVSNEFICPTEITVESGDLLFVIDGEGRCNEGPGGN